MNPIQDLSNFFIHAFSLSSDIAIGSAVIVSFLVVVSIAIAVSALFASILTRRN